MARPLRIQYEDAFYHITSRGDRRGKIFLGDDDRRKFLKIVLSSKNRYGFIIHAFVLMGNHYHLLIETPKANLSAALGHINGCYAQYFNWRHRRVGHLLQGRYKSIVVDKDEYFLELVRYIHLNPVRAGIVRDPDRYRWSSHIAIIDERVAKEWRSFFDRDGVLRYFGRREREAMKAYRSFILAGFGIKRKDVFKALTHGYILGEDNFVDWVRSNFVDDEKINKEIQGSKEFEKGFDCDEVLSAAGAAFNVSRRDIIRVRRGRGVKNEARLLSMYLLARHSPMVLRDIGKLFGGVSDVAVSLSVKQCENLLETDKKFKMVCEELMGILKIS